MVTKPETQSTTPIHATQPYSRKPRRLLRVVAAFLLLALGLLAVGAFFFGSPLLLDALTETRESKSTVDLESDGHSAQVVVPAGWAAGQLPWKHDYLRLRTPDGILTIDVWLTSEPVDSAPLQTASQHAQLSSTPSALSTESLPNAMTWKHTDVARDLSTDSSSDGQPIFIASGSRAEVSAVDAIPLQVDVVASIHTDDDVSLYRVVIAQVLGEIEIVR